MHAADQPEAPDQYRAPWLQGKTTSEEEDDALMAQIDASFFHPRVSDPIFCPKRPMTAQEIVDEALAYKPIAL